MSTRRLDDPYVTIKALERRLSDVEAKLGRVGGKDAVRVSTSVTDTETTLGTSATSVGSTSFTIPSGWSEYEMSAVADISVDNAGVLQVVSSRIDIGGDVGTTQSDGRSDEYRVLHPAQSLTGITNSRTLTAYAWADTQGRALHARIFLVARRTG